MPTDKDYAWMAAAAYNTGRNTENRIKVAFGWDPVNDLKGTENDSTGFASVTYRNTANGEVVMAFRGTDSSKDWTAANIRLYMGFSSRQLIDAVNLYFEGLKSGVPSSKISFTGHSLGGDGRRCIGTMTMLPGPPAAQGNGLLSRFATEALAMPSLGKTSQNFTQRVLAKRIVNHSH